jgi:Tfp pilus assembly protein PilN
LSERFDYLHSPRPAALRRVMEYRLPDRLFAPVCALAAALTITGGAGVIEAYRYKSAAREQAAYERRFQAAEAAVRQAKIYYARIRSLADLDGQVNRIASSGDTQAATLAQVGNALPAHAWLTRLSRNGEALTLEGRARRLETIGETLAALANVHGIQDPVLVSVTSDAAAKGALLSYQITARALTR